MRIFKSVAVAVVVAVGGCSESAPVSSPPSAAPAVTNREAVRIGAVGSACEMPLSFEVATDWKPVAVDLEAFGELAALGRVGDFSVVCEIDAKPAGHIGFLRVYQADDLSGQPREQLAAFLKAGTRGQEISGTTYQDVQFGTVQGAEMTWQSYDKGLDHHGKYSAFALNTRAGAVIVQLSPFGAEEHPAMLPAFELARKTLSTDT